MPDPVTVPLTVPTTLYEDTENLLRLFDNLSPDDKARCDEINARFACYIIRASYRARIEPDGRYTHDWKVLRRETVDGWRFKTSRRKGKFSCVARQTSSNTECMLSCWPWFIWQQGIRALRTKSGSMTGLRVISSGGETRKKRLGGGAVFSLTTAKICISLTTCTF